MIIEKILIKGIEAHNKVFGLEFRQDSINLHLNHIWNKPNTLRLYFYENIDAIVIRGINSLAKTEIPIGSLTLSQYVDGKVVYFDDIYWFNKFGKSCVFYNDAPLYELFMRGKARDIHPRYTEGNLISKIAMGNVLTRMNIPFEFSNDADVILLPSRNKFGCGYSRFMYIDKEKRSPEDEGVRYEAGWISYYINHDLFQDILPPEEYTRELSQDPNHAGINGIENEFPEFKREQFYQEWFQEIANLLNDTLDEKDIIEKELI